MARILMAEYAALPHTIGRWTTAAADIAALPTPYVASQGRLLIAIRAPVDSTGNVPLAQVALGCGAVLALPEPSSFELKRVYVRQLARSSGYGEAITQALVEWARSMGATRIRLDTAPELASARALYTRLGFRPIPPYRAGLLPDAICMELELE